MTETLTKLPAEAEDPFSQRCAVGCEAVDCSYNGYLTGYWHGGAQLLGGDVSTLGTLNGSGHDGETDGVRVSYELSRTPGALHVARRVAARPAWTQHREVRMPNEGQFTTLGLVGPNRSARCPQPRDWRLGCVLGFPLPNENEPPQLQRNGEWLNVSEFSADSGGLTLPGGGDITLGFGGYTAGLRTSALVKQKDGGTLDVPVELALKREAGVLYAGPVTTAELRPGDSLAMRTAVTFSESR